MSMQVLTKFFLTLFLGGILFSSCQKEPIYEVNNENLYLVSADKDKLKTNTQYIAILHANLFQKALSANDLVEIQKLIESVGDKRVIQEVIISNFLNKPGVIIPSDFEMLSDVDGFIKETYERFLVRQPTQAELTYFRNYILQNAPSNTQGRFAELIYFSFALSDEYQYY